MTRVNSWPDDDVEELKRLMAEGFTQSQIARKLGFTTSKVGAKISRLRGYKSVYHRRARPVDPTAPPKDAGWTETRLTEPYAVFKLRKQRERQACRT